MFDAKQFARSAVRESIAIGNSAHPVAEYVTSLLARPVPGREDLWYIRTKDDQTVITYRKSDRTLSFYEMSFADFRRLVESRALPSVDVLDIPETDKYIGNTVYRMLSGIIE